MAGERCPSTSQLGECCKLPHWGLGLCPRSQRNLHLTTLQNYTRISAIHTNYAFICTIAGVKVGGGGGGGGGGAVAPTAPPFPTPLKKAVDGQQLSMVESCRSMIKSCRLMSIDDQKQSINLSLIYDSFGVPYCMWSEIIYRGIGNEPN